MKTNYQFLKNSNTGELVKKQYFTETGINGIPTYFYNANGRQIGEDLELTGFVTISEKKFNREKRKL
jgi:hypothetical protein